MEAILFTVFSVVAVGGGVMTITRRNPLASALSLAVSFMAVAGLYTLLHSPFLAVMQVIVYAGAIMVLIIFVIMLLNLPDEAYASEELSRPRVGIGLLIGGALFAVLYRGIDSLETEMFEEAPASFGTVEAVGETLFTRYLYPFELVSILLLVAIVGAVVLAKRRLD